MRIHAADAIDIAARLGRSAFLDDRPMQHAVIRCLTVVGEAANRVSEETCIALPHVEWSEAIGLRNVLVHDYRGIDMDRIWTIVEQDLPPLLSALDSYLSSIE